MLHFPPKFASSFLYLKCPRKADNSVDGRTSKRCETCRHKFGEIPIRLPVSMVVDVLNLKPRKRLLLRSSSVSREVFSQAKRAAPGYGGNANCRERHPPRCRYKGGCGFRWEEGMKVPLVKVDSPLCCRASQSVRHRSLILQCSRQYASARFSGFTVAGRVRQCQLRAYSNAQFKMNVLVALRLFLLYTHVFCR